MVEIPAYIEDRIRRPVPPDAFVVPGSTPVVSFGNARIATVATLGLNPSRVEFAEKGVELTDASRRLATLTSLGVSDLVEAPREAVAQVLEDCNTYFDRNPYRFWFDQLIPVLNACGASYYDGSACHLDLVQWATDPIWGKLKRASLQKQLLEEDAHFLAEQLRNENLRLLLVNGMGVVNQLQMTIAGSLEEQEPIVGYASSNTRLFSGMLFDRVRVIAWSTNLQSSWGVTDELRSELPKCVAALAGATSA